MRPGAGANRGRGRAAASPENARRKQSVTGQGFHEQLAEGKVKKSSERTFGLVFAAFLCIIGLIPLLHHGHIRLWALIAAAAFLVAALVAPKILQPLNHLWFLLGRL